MRLLASMALAGAALAVSAVPAGAITKNVHVPVLDCVVTVETTDFVFAVSPRGARVQPMGQTRVSQDCLATP